MQRAHCDRFRKGRVPRAFFVAALALVPLAVPATASLRDSVIFREFFDTMTFDRPLLFAQYPGEDSAYVVVEQVGRITTVERRDDAWTKTDSARIATMRIGNGSSRQFNQASVFSGTHTGLYESRGLLGFAFHPAFRENGKYYVSYITVRDSATGDGPVPREYSIIAERIADTASLRPRTGDPERVVLALNQHPYWDHKGGTIRFGPDGHLYFATGDGGGINPDDNFNRAQNPAVFFGKMLRLDVDGPDDFSDDTNRNYAIPADNPFVDSAGFLPGIWAYGLRNPWKWHFHPITGELWAGDVGAGSRESITRVPKGGNLGWKIWEGDQCRVTALCDDPARRLVFPALNLPIGNRRLAASITGGAFFVRDSARFDDAYFFGDYITGRVWAARFDGDALIDSVQIGNVSRIASVDRDSLGRVFIVSLGTGGVTPNTGRVYVLESPGMEPGSPVRVGSPRARFAPVHRIVPADVLRNPAAYELRALDGRLLRGSPSGTVWVRKKGESSPPQLLSFIQ